MNIFFDVDYTILAVDNSLRPGTRDVFDKLVSDGHKVYIWSGVGIRTAEVRRHKLDDVVSGVYQKPIEDFEAGLVTWGVDVRPDFVIDDHPEIVTCFGGFICRPYYFKNPDDDEMRQIYDTVSQLTNGGQPEHTAFRPGVAEGSGGS